MDVKEYFDTYAEEYIKQDRYQYFWYKWLIDTIVLEAKPTKGDSILDLGTGTGIIPQLLSPHVGTSGSIIGVDVSENMIEEARKRAKGIPNISYKISSMEGLDLPEHAFDAVTTNLAIDHVQDRTSLAQKVKRWLRPGGRFVIGLNFKENREYNILVEALRRENPRKARLADESWQSFWENADQSYKQEHPEEFETDGPQLKRTMEEAGFGSVLIPSYHKWFGIVVGIAP